MKPVSYYDEFYSSGGFSRWINSPQVSFLYRAIVDIIDDGRVIDIGSGCGEMGRLLARKGVAYLGLDWSQVGVDQAREMAPGCLFECVDVEAEGLKKHLDNFRPDTAVSVQTFEHLRDDVGICRVLLSQCDRVLFSVPHGETNNGEDHPAGHLRSYNQDSILERFGHLGDVSFIEYPYSNVRILTLLS